MVLFYFILGAVFMLLLFTLYWGVNALVFGWYDNFTPVKWVTRCVERHRERVKHKQHLKWVRYIQTHEYDAGKGRQIRVWGADT